jgi:ATP-binding cassette subfamily A (ABC1) protein 3
LASDPPAILAKHIRKVYRVTPTLNTLAVDDVSFCTKKGECFALLGTSGAGKTTIFKMLTQDVKPTKGEITMDGMDLATRFPEIRKKMGYAPQYESSYFQMTVRENLEFYAKIKGIRLELREKLIMKLMVDMSLKEYEHVLAGDLSGGNKRKLTVALAIIGNPSIVFLDEPSTGVDPQAKRFMWFVIQKISTKNKNTAVILTTHSMEEAEALCTKMAIMVNGNFCCIGSPLDLKTNYGKGYEVQISIPYPAEKDELAFINNINAKSNTDLTAEASLNKEQILAMFSAANREDLAKQLTKEGLCANIHSELELGRLVKAKIIAAFIIIEQCGREFAYDLAKEYGDVKVAEHMGNFFKFRIKEKNSIGYLFGKVQDLTEKHSIINYSASQTSLAQIFQTFAKQAEVIF